MSNTDELAEIIYRYYIMPKTKSKYVQTMTKLLTHELTCGDLSHMHGAVIIKWDKPNA